MNNFICVLVIFSISFVTARYLGDREVSYDKRGKIRNLVDRIQFLSSRGLKRREHDDDHGFLPYDFDSRKKYKYLRNKFTRSDYDSYEDSFESLESMEDDKPIIVVVIDKNGEVGINNEKKVVDYVKGILESKGIYDQCDCKDSEEYDSSEEYSEEYSSEELDIERSTDSKKSMRNNNKSKKRLRCGCNKKRRDFGGNIKLYEETGNDNVIRMFLKDLKDVLSPRHNIKSNNTTNTTITRRCGNHRCGFLTGRHDDDNIENLVNYFDLLILSDHDNEELL